MSSETTETQPLPLPTTELNSGGGGGEGGLLPSTKALKSMEDECVAGRCILASSDPGEELDDLFAFKYGFLYGATRQGVRVHIIISCGSLPPMLRLNKLNEYMKSSAGEWTFGEEKLGITLFPDDEHLHLEESFYSAYVNNGPLTAATMAKVAVGLKDDAVCYFVGSAADGKAGGVNQADATPGIEAAHRFKAWNDQFLPAIERKREGKGKLQIVPILPEISVRVRFPNSPQLFPPNSVVRSEARATVGMFITSRPGPEGLHYDQLLRFNTSNCSSCQAWLAELSAGAGAGAGADGFVSPRAKVLAREKCGDYFARGALPGLSPLQREALWSVALVPLELTYELALRAFANRIRLSEGGDGAVATTEQPYAANKFGFSPTKKSDLNPDLAFVDDFIFEEMCELAMGAFRTLTPAYDLLSALLAVEGQGQPVCADRVPHYNEMVAMALLEAGAEAGAGTGL